MRYVWQGIQWGVNFAAIVALGSVALLATEVHTSGTVVGRDLPDVQVWTEPTTPDDVTLTIIGGWPTDPLKRCWLLMDIGNLDYSVCDSIKENLG